MSQECVQQGFLEDQAQENGAADSKQSAKPSHTGSLCCECGSASQSRLALPSFPHVMELGKMSITPCGTRAHNLRIRSPTPCPLGQGGLQLPLAQKTQTHVSVFRWKDCHTMIWTQTLVTVCQSGLRGWTQIPLAQAAWAQIPQLSTWMGSKGKKPRHGFFTASMSVVFGGCLGNSIGVTGPL